MKRIAILLFLAVLAAGSQIPAPAAATAPRAQAVQPAGSLSVFIGGLRQINSSAWCTWEASAWGGTEPYTYSWSTVNGGGSGYDNAWGGHFPVSGSLTAVVTDALGATGTATINVASVYNGPWCP